MICAPAKSLEPTTIAGGSPVEPLSLFEPPDDPQAASTRTKPTSIAPSARPLNRILAFRMIRVLWGSDRRSAGGQTLRARGCVGLGRRDRRRGARRDAGVRVDALRPVSVVGVRTRAQSLRDDEVLHEREGQLDRDGEERDQERPREEPLVVVDARTVVDV